MRLRREALGLTQQEIADRLGIKQTSYSQYERGRNSVSATDIPRIAAALECSIIYLFGEDDDEQSRLESVLVNHAVTSIMQCYSRSMQRKIIGNLVIKFINEASSSSNHLLENKHHVEEVKRAIAEIDNKRSITSDTEIDAKDDSYFMEIKGPNSEVLHLWVLSKHGEQ